MIKKAKSFFLQRKLYSRNDRFLSEGFGNDIHKKIKTLIDGKIVETKPIEENKEYEIKNKHYKISLQESKIKDFMDGLKIDDFSKIKNEEERKLCPLCNRKRK